MAACQVLGIQGAKALNSAMASHDWLCLVIAGHGRLLLAEGSDCQPLLAIAGHGRPCATAGKGQEVDDLGGKGRRGRKDSKTHTYMHEIIYERYQKCANGEARL